MTLMKRKIPRRPLALALCLPLLAGCTSFQRHPVGTASEIAMLPLAIPLVVPLALMRIADDPTRGPRPPNQQPLYGGITKTPAMIAADQQFIAASAKYGDRAHTSDMSVALGWKYLLARKDPATAMERFNQAWLLDPDNGDAFHGFAIIVMDRDHDIEQADALFRQGTLKPRQSPGIFLDYGRFLVRVHRPAQAIAPLRKALSIPDMGPDAQALLTLALDQSGDAAAACAESAKVQDGAQKDIRDAARKVCRNP